MTIDYELQWLQPAAAKPLRLPPNQRITIGRDEDNNLHLPDGLVSCLHASLEPTEQGWRLIDNRSTNGTFVNEERHTEALLRAGDIVQIGAYIFQIVEAVTTDALEFSFDIESKAITVGLGLDVGKVRQPPNQDSIGSFSDQELTTEQLAKRGYLFVVADGMGGHKGGEVASEIAVEKSLEEYYKPDTNIDSTKEKKAALGDSYREVHNEIRRRADQDDALADMGATMVTALVTDEEIVIGNVGDSRAYRLRAGQLEQLTIDQTFAQQLLSQGVLSTEEFETSPLNHILSQALGRGDQPEVEFVSKSVKKGDVFLLCSDGLSNVVPEQEMITILQTSQGKDAANRLIEQAKSNGGPDNVGAIVLHISFD